MILLNKVGKIATSLFDTAMFAGLGEAVITFYIVLPIMSITGAVYVGYKHFLAIHKLVYSIIMSFTYTSAIFVEYNIRDIVENGEFTFLGMLIPMFLVLVLCIYLITYLRNLIKYIATRLKNKKRKE